VRFLILIEEENVSWFWLSFEPIYFETSWPSPQSLPFFFPPTVLIQHLVLIFSSYVGSIEDCFGVPSVAHDDNSNLTWESLLWNSSYK